ncbi:ABC transporter permease [Silicimonas algicola]|uniref:NitT/TauT family transport system permease protein n=1 Tax=Silicimonas algicola TaxID=1826607 RepID=A0A316GMD4_9RHOB|nr:NitT/TauT family transport system permease protein [Silicimonas algicola]
MSIDPAVPMADSAPVLDREEAQRLRAERLSRTGRWALPILVFVLVIAGWHWLVTAKEIPHYILPGPGLVASTLWQDFGILAGSWLVTLTVTGLALLLAVVFGGGLAILFTQSKWIEMSFFPYAVVLQVTPIVAIAPLIFIYVDSKIAGLLICAWIVAFFPILSNTTLGLNSADHNLRDLFSVYGASRWQRLRYLQLPAALPYFLGGLRIAGGLSLIGAVVAEFVAGSGGIGSGLAFRILESSYRLNTPRMFAALTLIVVTGVAIYLVLSWVTWMLLRKWHESALKRDA